MRAAAVVVLAMTLAFSAGAQESQRVLRVRPFTGDALTSGESTALLNLVTSYVVELRSFRVIDSSGQELAMKEAETAVQLGVPKDIDPLSADFILSGDASLAGGVIVFTLAVTKVSSGEKRSVSDTANNVNELILDSRGLVRNLFEQATGPTALATASPPTPPGTDAYSGSPGPGAATAPPPTATGGSSPGAAEGSAPSGLSFVTQPELSSVAGAWKGDKGIDRISLFGDGRGIAILASGASMRVRAEVLGPTIVVTQDQPSIPDYYRSPGLGYSAAKHVAALARPWKWILSLASDGNSLIGIKESVFVKVDGAGTVSVDNNYVRDAVWTRLFR
ncbi:MAG TPA: hypothetical protein VMC79_04385 [Rectinemataceae bacterium]|nr:hypothetical protein [Rectinemataceae bacterium]